ncbi:MAG: alpha/beta fold hydrolase [Rhodobiaceae bacterium]|nr:alpha/beta fold hydrolase [Rhodobiaceae bacterium]
MTMIHHTGTETTAPVLAIHASASGPSQWRRLADDMAIRHHVITPDMSTWRAALSANDVPYAGLRPAVEAALDQAGTANRRMHIVGHSFGGAVALKLALTRPDLVASLTLYEPTAPFLLDRSGETDGPLVAELRALGRTLTQSADAGHPELGMRRFVAFWTGSDDWDAMPESRRLRMVGAVPSVISDFAGAFSERTRLADLKAITVPTLVMTGMDSPQIAQRTAALVARAITGAELALLPALGHMAPVTQPDWVNPRIRQHIARVERRAERVRWPHRAAA